jgi:hypothetical protein
VNGGRPGAAEGDDVLLGDPIRQAEDRRSGLQVDRLRPATGEARKLVEALVDAVHLARLAERTLACNDAPVAATARDVRRPGNDVPLAQRIAREVGAGALAKLPDAANRLVAEDDRQRNGEKAMMEVDVSAADPGQIDLGDHSAGVGIGNWRGFEGNRGIERVEDGGLRESLHLNQSQRCLGELSGHPGGHPAHTFGGRGDTRVARAPNSDRDGPGSHVHLTGSFFKAGRFEEWTARSTAPWCSSHCEGGEGYG